MKSSLPGKNTSVAEVQNISGRGIWVHVKGREYFLSYEDHPWFKNARVGEIQNIRFLNGMHLHWPDLDVDLELESLGSPEKYPLIYR